MQASSGTAQRGAGGGAARAPELPRVRLDTRMPAAPAPEGRVISVDPPARPDRGMGDLWIVGAAVLLLLALTVLGWRQRRQRRARHHLR